MLTKTKKRIVKEIKRLHKRGEPLNITAVKRRHPKLLEAVYKIKPFWGWKRALEDAGIGYRTIKVELQDYVDCALCGKVFQNLSRHLIFTHEVQLDEYWMDHPDADLWCEELRARILK